MKLPDWELIERVINNYEICYSSKDGRTHVFYLTCNDQKYDLGHLYTHHPDNIKHQIFQEMLLNTTKTMDHIYSFIEELKKNPMVEMIKTMSKQIAKDMDAQIVKELLSRNDINKTNNLLSKMYNDDIEIKNIPNPNGTTYTVAFNKIKPLEYINLSLEIESDKDDK